MSASSTGLLAAEGPGSVSQAPNLADGFTDTFTSRYVDAGALRLHAVIGGDGPPLLLVHGWPQTWYAWRLMMPALAENFEVIAVDQRGMGLSDKPRDGYDTATVANDLVALMDALGHQRFAMVGCDTGLLIGYALAADHPDRVDRLALGEAPLPGVSPTPPLFLPGPLNERLWHIPFNALPEVNEKLVSGREDIFFGEKLSNAAGRKKLSTDAVKYYVDLLAADPEALRGCFELYRAFPVSQAQNEQRKTRRLAMPVWRSAERKASANRSARTMEFVADDVQTVRSARLGTLARRAGSGRDARRPDRVPGPVPTGGSRPAIRAERLAVGAIARSGPAAASSRRASSPGVTAAARPARCRRQAPRPGRRSPARGRSARCPCAPAGRPRPPGRARRPARSPAPGRSACRGPGGTCPPGSPSR